jgi:hypothetical protein
MLAHRFSPTRVTILTFEIVPGARASTAPALSVRNQVRVRISILLLSTISHNIAKSKIMDFIFDFNSQ